MAASTRGAEASPAAKLQASIARFEPGIQRLVRAVRSAVRKRFPTANELTYDYRHAVVISYSPTERGIDAVVAISGRADGVALYFNQGARLPDPKGLLEGSARQVRYITVTSARQLAHRDVKALLAAALAQAKIPLARSGRGRLVSRPSSRKKAQ